MPDARFRTRPATVRDQYASTLTSAVRSISDVAALPEKGTPEFEVLATFADDIKPMAVVPEPMRWPAGPNLASAIDLLRTDCAQSVTRNGLARKGKHNAAVGKNVLTAAFPGDELLTTIRSLTGLTHLKAVSASYIVYDGPGADLQLHIDKPTFGDLNLLVRLDDPPELAEPSATVFVHADGPYRMPLRAGEGILFDGTALLHGRTPLAVGETVTLLTIGVRNEDE